MTGSSQARKIGNGEKCENVYQQVVGQIAKWGGLRCTFRVIEQYCCSVAILSKLGFPCKLLPPRVRLSKIFFFWFPVSPPGEVILRQEEHKLASGEISMFKQIAVSFTVSSEMANHWEDDLVLPTPHTREAISKAT